MSETLRETDLYPPVKRLLEGQGYEVKSEVGAADVMGMRPGGAPVIVEMKLGFSLALFHQAVDRQRLTDAVYIAVHHRSGRRFQSALRSNLTLARRLGIGVLTVRLSDGHVTVHTDPGIVAPRKSKRRGQALLREFAKRQGDPNQGGQTRTGLTTAYRQDACRIAAFIGASGPSKGAVVAGATGVVRATRIMADNHYGWFERVGRGVYSLSELGREVLSMNGPPGK